MPLPADSHVHSEWSWDAVNGSMERTCARAVSLGLPAVAFTEHADYTPWIVVPEDLNEYQRQIPAYARGDQVMTPPELDLSGYLECLQRCRDLFPDLHIISGVELGEPHWHLDVATELLAAGQFDRVLGSLHSLPLGDQYGEFPALYRRYPAADVVRDYLAELPNLIGSSARFDVLAHLDYPVRSWPAAAGPFDPTAFQDGFRHVLRLLADSGRALEVNTRVPLDPRIVRWWREEGGVGVTFGSDTHGPDALAHGFAAAVALVEAHGFRPGRHPYDVWTR